MFTGEIVVYIMKQFVVLVTKVIAMKFLCCVRFQLMYRLYRSNSK